LKKASRDRIHPVLTPSTDAEPSLRVATPADAEAVEALMKLSAAALFPRFYDEVQAASAVEHVATVDPDLLADGSYFVLEHEGHIVACGGWSRRDKLYTGGIDAGSDRLLDPASEPARIRAMFVREDWMRRGLGRRILEASEVAARAEGFIRLRLSATLVGLPFYLANGFEPLEETEETLPDGTALVCVLMEKEIAS
jgi:GNAT superfamily N-acetyltransferase